MAKNYEFDYVVLGETVDMPGHSTVEAEDFFEARQKIENSVADHTVIAKKCFGLDLPFSDDDVPVEEIEAIAAGV